MIAKRTTEISAELHARAARTIPFGTPSRYRGHSDVVMARAYKLNWLRSWQMSESSALWGFVPFNLATASIARAFSALQTKA